jgi:hypothetical protein
MELLCSPSDRVGGKGTGRPGSIKYSSHYGRFISVTVAQVNAKEPLRHLRRQKGPSCIERNKLTPWIGLTLVRARFPLQHVQFAIHDAANAMHQLFKFRLVRWGFLPKRYGRQLTSCRAVGRASTRRKALAWSAQAFRPEGVTSQASRGDLATLHPSNDGRGLYPGRLPIN